MKKVISILLAALMLAGLCACKTDVGIIGGADGPTDVFVTKVDGSTSAEPSEEPSTEPSAEPTAEGDDNKSDDEEDEEMQYPQVTITMEDGGVMVAELYPEIAPNTVNNFISLVKSGFYDGLIFHRVIEGFMLQGGDPEGTGSGGPDYSIKGEFTSNGFQNDLKHTPGVLSMARTQQPDSAGSQFFIMTSTQPHLDGEYAAFGKVIEGMDVAYKIETVDTDEYDRPKVEQKIKSITVDTFGVEYPEPEVIK